MNLKELKKLKEISDGYSMMAYKIEDKIYPSSNGNYLKVEIILEKIVLKEREIDIGQTHIAHLIAEAEETTLPKRHSALERGHSIYQYMEILGIDRKDIYATSTIKKGCSIHEALRTEADKRARGYGKDTIYKRNELYELEFMLKEAKKKKLKAIHPDLHSQDKEYFESETAKINNAYDKALNILRWRGL